MGWLKQNLNRENLIQKKISKCVTTEINHSTLEIS